MYYLILLILLGPNRLAFVNFLANRTLINIYSKDLVMLIVLAQKGIANAYLPMQNFEKISPRICSL